MGTAKRYLKKIHRETNFYATWTPSQVVELGDYGPLRADGTFAPRGNVKDLGAPALVVRAADRPDDALEVTSDSGTTIAIKAAGEVLPGTKLPQAKAGIAFAFDRSDALVFKLDGARQEAIGNLGALEAWVVERYKAGEWTKDWRVVSQRIVAKGTTIVYSSEGTVQVEATAEADIADIADPTLAFKLVLKQGGSVTVLGAPGLTPVMSLVKLQMPLFGTPQLDLRSFTPKMVRDVEASPVFVPEIPE